jgi:hypothetical protein
MATCDHVVKTTFLRMKMRGTLTLPLQPLLALRSGHAFSETFSPRPRGPDGSGRMGKEGDNGRPELPSHLYHAGEL